MKRMVVMIVLGLLCVGIFSGCPAGSTYINPYTIHYFQSSWSTPYIHFNNGVGWTTAPGELMTSEGNNWWSYIVDTAEGTPSITVVFNDGGSSWDNNNNNDYSVSDKEVWILSGNILTSNPTLQTHQIIIHYRKSSIFSGTPTLSLGVAGQTPSDVSSISNDASGNQVYVVNKAGGLTYSFDFKQGATTEAFPSTRYISTLLTDREIWVWKQHRGVFNSDPETSVIADPGAGITNNMGATVSGGNVNFVFFSGIATNVGIKVNSASIQNLKLTSDAKYWWIQTPASAGDSYFYQLNGGAWVADPYANKIGSWDGTKNAESSIIVDHSGFTWSDSSYVTPLIQDVVVYELHVEDFTLTASDVTASERGNIKGITEKLSYLTNLGINTIEIMPSQQFQGGGSSYSWGYMTRLFFALSERYRGAGDEVFDMKTLVNTAHNMGIAVILDMVYNHAENSPNYLWQIDNEYYFNAWGLNAGGVGYNNINSTRPMNVRFLKDNMSYWMQDYHIDGFRLDLTGQNLNAPSGQSAIDHGTLSSIATYLKTINSNVILIAENWSYSDNTLPSWSKWEGDFKSSIYGILNNGYDDVARFVWGNRDSNRFTKPTQSIMYICSHDESSIYNMFDTQSAANKLIKAKLGAAILFTSMAVPMIWMGEEMGVKYWNATTSKPIDWTLLSQTDNTNLFNYYHGLLQLRRENDCFRRVDYPTTSQFRWCVTPGNWGLAYNPVVNSTSGAVGFIDNYDGTSAGGRFFVLFNYSAVSKNISGVGLPVDGTWLKVVNGDEVDLGGIAGEDIFVSSGLVTNTIVIPAKTAFIYQAP